MAGVNGWSKNGIGKSRRSRSRASTPSRFFRCCKIHFAGLSEKRPSRVLPTMTEMTVMLLLLTVSRKKKGRLIRERISPTRLSDCEDDPARRADPQPGHAEHQPGVTVPGLWTTLPT